MMRVNFFAAAVTNTGSRCRVEAECSPELVEGGVDVMKGSVDGVDGVVM